MHRQTPARPPALLVPALCAALLGALSGCSGGGELGAEPGSVREALFRFNDALKRLDKEEARRWVVSDQVHQNAFEYVYRISEVQQQLIAKVTERWGADGLAVLQEAPGAQLDEIVPYATSEVLDKIITQEVGDVAMATFEDGRRQRLVRREGRWLVDTVGSDRQEDLPVIFYQLELMIVYARAIHDSLPEIDKPDVELDYFDMLLGRQIQTRVQEFEENLMKAAQEAERKAAEQSQGAVGPAPPGAEPPPDDGHDHGG